MRFYNQAFFSLLEKHCLMMARMMALACKPSLIAVINRTVNLINKLRNSRARQIRDVIGSRNRISSLSFCHSCHFGTDKIVIMKA